MIRFRFFPLLAIPFLGLALLAASPSDDPQFSGTYVLNEEASDDVMEAFEPILQEMNFVVRRLARSRMREAIQPDERIEIAHGSEDIAIQTGDGPIVRTPSDGEAIQHETDEGTTVELSTHLDEDGVLHQRIASDQFHRITEYRLSPDGQELTVDVRMNAEQLPQPISYRLVYNREQ